MSDRQDNSSLDHDDNDNKVLDFEERKVKEEFELELERKLSVELLKSRRTSLLGWNDLMSRALVKETGKLDVDAPQD